MPIVRNKSIDRAAFKQMIDEYYELHGWDDQGVPRPETLEKLGLDREPCHTV
jgi:aldehyde:ferredoxin oxidoreductase